MKATFSASPKIRSCYFTLQVMYQFLTVFPAHSFYLEETRRFNFSHATDVKLKKTTAHFRNGILVTTNSPIACILKAHSHSKIGGSI